MSLLSDSDNDAFMDLGGIEINVNGLTVTALFDNEYQRTDQFGRVVIQTSAPMLTIPTHVAEDAGIARDDEVTTPDDQIWLVKEIKPDAQGMTEIRLVAK